MKKMILGFFILVIVGASAIMLNAIEKLNPRITASIPNNYDAMKGCEKQEVLWQKVVASAYKELPEFKSMGLPQLISMSMQEIQLKGNLHSDFAPDGWIKYLHRRGSLAKIKIVPVNNKYSGIFQGANCGLLRLSLTYKVAGSKPVAPGLALKILRDGTYSANVSALVSLEGQDKDFNFFKNPMSNIVPVSDKLGQKLVHKVFNKVTQYPEELVVNDMAAINAEGLKANQIVSPRQLFFVPTQAVNIFSSDEHDVRQDFSKIAPETTVYQIYALADKYNSFDYSQYSPEMMVKFLKESEHIGDIITTSEFISSEFGDDGIFFRHQIRN